jgi:hypothetical protein
METSIVPVRAASVTVNAINAAMATEPVNEPTTQAITFTSQTNASCDCTQLRYAVIALSTILGTLVLSLVVFAVLKTKRWTRQGASARDGEVKELKRQKDDAERRERDAMVRGYGGRRW